MRRLSTSIKFSVDDLTAEPVVWLRPLLVVAVLIFSAALPFLPGKDYHIYLLGLVPGIVFALIILRQPVLGLPLLIAASLLIPFEIGTGTETSINPTILILMALIGVWVLRVITRIEGPGLESSRPFVPLLIFIIVVLISFLFGQLPWFSFARQAASLTAQIGGVLLILLSAGAFLFTANQIKETRWLEWMTWLFIALGGIFMLGWVLPPVGSITGRFFQFGAVDGGMFWTWLVALTFSQVLINKKLKWGWRLVLGVIVAMTLYVGYFLNSGWKSGYLPPLVAVFIILMLRSWKVGLVVLITGAILLPVLLSDAVSSDQYSYSTRVDAGLIMAEIIRTNPILGFGPANYYYFTPLFPIRGYAVEFNSHNQYIDIVAQVGLLGMAVLLWFFAEVARLGFKLRNRVNEGFEQAYVYGALGGLVGTLAAGMLADWFLPFVYNVGYRGFRASVLAWLFLGGLVSLDIITRKREKMGAA